MNQIRLKIFEALTKNFLESVDEVRDACNVGSQNPSKCEHLKKIACLKIRVMLLESGMHQLKIWR